MTRRAFEWSKESEEYFFKTTNEERKNAMSNAFINRDWDAFYWMFNHGIHPNDVSYDMLWDAVRLEDEDAVSKLLALNYDVHRLDDIAFRDAVKTGNKKIVIMLKEAGANPRAVNDDSMSIAAANGDVIMIRLLKSWGVPAEGWKNDPLLRATESNSKEAVKELLKLGATLDDEEGFYLPIRAAINRGYRDTGEVLLKNLKDVPQVIDSLDKKSAYLPENWKSIIDNWLLTLALKI